jgi:hypothetical protein
MTDLVWVLILTFNMQHNVVVIDNIVSLQECNILMYKVRNVYEKEGSFRKGECFAVRKAR